MISVNPLCFSTLVDSSWAQKRAIVSYRAFCSATTICVVDLAIEYLTRPVRHPQRLHHHDWIRSFSRIESFARLKYDYKVSKNQRSNKQSPFSCYYDSCVEEAVSGAVLKVSFCFRTIRQWTEVLVFLLSSKGRSEWINWCEFAGFVFKFPRFHRENCPEHHLWPTRTRIQREPEREHSVSHAAYFSEYLTTRLHSTTMPALWWLVCARCMAVSGYTSCCIVIWNLNLVDECILYGVVYRADGIVYYY